MQSGGQTHVWSVVECAVVRSQNLMVRLAAVQGNSTDPLCKTLKACVFMHMRLLRNTPDINVTHHEPMFDKSTLLMSSNLEIR